MQSAAWLRQVVSHLALDGPGNRLAEFGGQPIFGEVLVGVADGADPLFEAFQQAVCPGHLQPRDVLKRHAPASAASDEVRVIAWALAFTEPVRASNRRGAWPSALYSVARNNGGALNHEVRRGLVAALRERGHAAVAPVLTEQYDAFRSPEHTFTSTWSERHVAYAAGLGQFGLHGCLITKVGASVRLGSVVTSLPVEPTPRPYGSHHAPCVEAPGEICGLCIERCPVGAISRQGLDKSRCYQMRGKVRQRLLERYTRDFHLVPAPIVKAGERTQGYSLGCALCQCGVPCESCYPDVALSRKVRDA